MPFSLALHVGVRTQGVNQRGLLDHTMLLAGPAASDSDSASQSGSKRHSRFPGTVAAGWGDGDWSMWSE